MNIGTNKINNIQHIQIIFSLVAFCRKSVILILLYIIISASCRMIKWRLNIWIVYDTEKLCKQNTGLKSLHGSLVHICPYVEHKYIELVHSNHISTYIKANQSVGHYYCEQSYYEHSCDNVEKSI